MFVYIQYILPKRLLTYWSGLFASSKQRWLKNRLIHWAIKHFKIDLSDAVIQNPEEYPSFNAFFTRALLPQARPIDASQQSIISPCDGIVSEQGFIEYGTLIQAKNQTYSVRALVGDWGANYANGGSYATIYLSPRDYHRVHMPVDGQLIESVYQPGELFSVNEQTVEHIPRVLARNERLIARFETAFGEILVVFVGALLVAGIEPVWHPSTSTLRAKGYRFKPKAPLFFAKGDEIGQFHFGSTVIILLPPGRIDWSFTGTAINMGQTIALWR